MSPGHDREGTGIVPLSFRDWMEQQNAILREKYPNYDRWDTTGSQAVVIRVTKDQARRAMFKNLSSSGRYTVVAYDEDREVYRDVYHLEATKEGDAATGGRKESED